MRKIGDVDVIDRTPVTTIACKEKPWFCLCPVKTDLGFNGAHPVPTKNDGFAVQINRTGS